MRVYNLTHPEVVSVTVAGVTYDRLADMSFDVPNEVGAELLRGVGTPWATLACPPAGNVKAQADALHALMDKNFVTRIL